MSQTTGKTITCRAAVLWAAKEQLSIETIEVAPPKAGEVRIKIFATGICHSDYSVGISNPQGHFPVILGHEGAGIVESVGSGVTKFRPGDHVIPLFVTQCNECEFCKSPKTNICQKIQKTQEKGVLPDGTSRFRCKGKILHHFMGCSTFSEYTVVTDISLCKINENAPFDKVCLLGCGVSTGYGSALNIAKVEPGSVCGIWGLGTVGFAAAMGCRKAGASKIFGIDINPAKFEIAKKFGCTDFINPKDYDGQNMQEVLKGMTNGGFDYTIECIGNVHTMRIAFESCRKGWGTCVIVGVSSPTQEISTYPIKFLSGRILKGGIFGGWKTVDAIPKLVEEYMKKELLLDEFITHKLKLDKINDAFSLMLDGKSIKSVIEIQ